MISPAVPADSVTLRALFARVPQSVVALCGLDDSGTPQGVTASSFTTVSLDPPLVSVAMARTSATWPLLRALPRLGISLLSESQGTQCRRLAAKNGDRFDGTPWRPLETGAVFIDYAAAEIECELFDELPAGDHTIALFLIRSISVDHQREPLVFHSSGFRRLAAAPHS